MASPPPEQIAAQLLVLFFGVGLHEYAHCKFADMAGDPTPSYYGRVTLNLTKHFEPMGTILMVLSTWAGFGIGWGRPAPMDPTKMKNPRLDLFVAVAAGPISNVMQAIVYALICRLFLPMDALGSPDIVVRFFALWLIFGVMINLGLALFNLIPFGPLDGHWLLGLLLPEKQRFYWFKFNRQVGMPGLIVVVLIMQSTGISLIGRPLFSLFQLFTGHQLYEYFPPIYE